MSKRLLIGLFGGTFDPIHIGHLRMALELKQKLGMDEMHLLPCHIPPHRQAPVASPAHRAAMAEMAVSACPDLSVDRMELANDQPSWSVHTLELMRERHGSEVSLCLAMGGDSLASLDRWHRWEELTGLAHLVVAMRPGWPLPASGPVADLIRERRTGFETLRDSSHGKIVIEELSLLDVSSTEIRREIAAGRSAQFLLPDRVWAYILRNNLYRQPTAPRPAP